jgi:hypothetical protein
MPSDPARAAKYVRRPLPVQAVQWTRGNGPAVTELLRTVKPFWFARDNPHGGWQSVVDHHYKSFGNVSPAPTGRRAASELQGMR